MESTKLYNSPFVANNIKLYAKSKNISLKDILIDCGLGSNTFSHMLHGKSIAYDSLARIADYLDCSVDYLLGRVNNPEEKTHQTNVLDTDKKITAPQYQRQTVYSYEGKPGENMVIDISKAEQLNKLLKSAQSLSDEQINLLTSMAENMKKD